MHALSLSCHSCLLVPVGRGFDQVTLRVNEDEASGVQLANAVFRHTGLLLFAIKLELSIMPCGEQELVLIVVG